jgi:hypothetical protein
MLWTYLLIEIVILIVLLEILIEWTLILMNIFKFI